MSLGAYYINPISDNNCLFSLDSVDGVVSFKNNRISFSLNYYIFQNAYLPLNLIKTNISSDFFTVEDVNLYRLNDSSIPAWISDGKYLQVYHTNFTFELSESFLKSEINHKTFFLDFELDYDETIGKNSQIHSTQDNFEAFINQVKNTKLNCELPFTNYDTGNNNGGLIENASEIYVNSKQGSYVRNEPLFYTTNQYSEMLTPVSSLVTLYTQEPIIIKKAELEISWEVDEKEHSCVLDTDIQTLVNDSFQFSVGDFISNTKVNENLLISKNGFYINEKSVGYYKLKIQVIDANENAKIYVFYNSFSFDENTNAKKEVKVKDLDVTVEEFESKFSEWKEVIINEI